jgi:hypothetical protein
VAVSVEAQIKMAVVEVSSNSVQRSWRLPVAVVEAMALDSRSREPVVV